jgi:hypothetical protein
LWRFPFIAVSYYNFIKIPLKAYNSFYGICSMKMEAVHFWFHVRINFIVNNNNIKHKSLLDIIILIIVGKSGYLLETLLGQFSSRGAAKLYDLCPAMRGIGYGQVVAMIYVISYYSSILGIALKYLYESSKNLIFGTPLPWTICKLEWGSECFSSSSTSSNVMGNTTDIIAKTPAQLYFK